MLRSQKTWLEFGSGADGYPFDKRRVECVSMWEGVLCVEGGRGAASESVPNSTANARRMRDVYVM